MKFSNGGLQESVNRQENIAFTPPRTTPPAADRSFQFAPRVASPKDLFLSLPGTKDIRQHPVYQGALSRWAWRIYTHRLTRAGRWFLGLTLIMGLTLAPGLDVQFYVPFLYLCGFWIVADAVCQLNRPRVRLRARHADRIRAGETLPVDVEITHVGRFWPALDLQVLPARLPLAVDAFPPDGVPVPTLLPGETQKVRLGLRCLRRGSYRLWGFRVETDYPFGLLNAYGQFPHESALLVYPAFEPLERMEALPTGRYHPPGGLLLASPSGGSVEYLGNREYREGDPIRDIDWRATARRGGQPIALREWREEVILRVGIVLDTFLPLRGESSAQNRVARVLAFERAISTCAAVADYAARQDYQVALLAAGPDLHHLTAARSLVQLEQILEILATVEGSDTDLLTTLAPQIAQYAGHLTTVLCVFVEWNNARQKFVDGLRASGVGVKVILVRGAGHDTAPFPPDATVIEGSDWQAGQPVIL